VNRSVSPNQKRHFTFCITFALSRKFGLSERLSEKLIKKNQVTQCHNVFLLTRMMMTVTSDKRQRTRSGSASGKYQAGTRRTTTYRCTSGSSTLSPSRHEVLLSASATSAYDTNTACSTYSPTKWKLEVRYTCFSNSHTCTNTNTHTHTYKSYQLVTKTNLTLALTIHDAVAPEQPYTTHEFRSTPY